MADDNRNDDNRNTEPVVPVDTGEPDDVHAIETAANHLINRMRNIAQRRMGPQRNPLPKLREVAERLRVAAGQLHRDVHAEESYSPSGRAMMPDGSTPPEVLSSPYAGEEPRHAQMVEDVGPRPDPIQRAGETSQSAASRTTGHSGPDTAHRGDDKRKG